MPEAQHHNQNAIEDSRYRQVKRGGTILRFSHKLALGFCLLLAGVTLAFWLLFQNELQRSIQEHNDILGRSLAEQTAASVRELVLINDLLGLNVELSQLVSDDNILSVSVHDVDDNRLASAGQLNSFPGNPNYYSAPILVQEAVAGRIILQLDPGTAVPLRARMRNLFFLVLGVSLILTVALAFALASQVISPLKALTTTINNRIDDGHETDYDIQQETGGDETLQLETAVERLLTQLQDMESQLLETGVWESSNRIEPARMAATLLVIRVVNMHTAIELLHPSTLTDLLNEYRFYLNQAAELYGGCIQRESGESVLLSFDAGTCGERHSSNALQCAGLFQSIMAQVNRRHRDKGEQVLEFRMAIHSGDVFLAPATTANRETDSFLALGRTVDITYFLSKQVSPNELVISESACSQAREFEAFEVSRRNQVSMPADNVSFMAYILDGDFAEAMPLVQKQRDHILGNTAHSGE